MSLPAIVGFSLLAGLARGAYDYLSDAGEKERKEAKKKKKKEKEKKAKKKERKERLRALKKALKPHHNLPGLRDSEDEENDAPLSSAGAEDCEGDYDHD